MNILTTTEIVAALNRCATGEGDGCASCTIKPMMNRSPFAVIGCAETLQLIAADRLKALEQELIDERYRHDRVQDFCVAQGEELSKLKEKQHE